MKGKTMWVGGAGHRGKKKVKPDMTVKQVLTEYVDKINTAFMCG